MSLYPHFLFVVAFYLYALFTRIAVPNATTPTIANSTPKIGLSEVFGAVDAVVAVVLDAGATVDGVLVVGGVAEAVPVTTALLLT